MDNLRFALGTIDPLTVAMKALSLPLAKDDPDLTETRKRLKKARGYNVERGKGAGIVRDEAEKLLRFIAEIIRQKVEVRE
jgi:hypothetical protein